MYHRKLLAGLLCLTLSFSTVSPALATEMTENTAVTDTVGDDSSENTGNTEQTDNSASEQKGTEQVGSDQSGADQTSGKTDNADAKQTDSSKTDSSAAKMETEQTDSKETGSSTASENSGSSSKTESDSSTAAEKDTSAVAEEAAAEEKALEEGSYEAWLKAIQESTKTNEELLAEQNITHVESHPSDFRFYQVKEKAAFAKEDLNIYSSCSAETDPVGSLEAGGLCYILQDKGDWFYIESGDVRGYIQASSLVGEKTAQEIYDAMLTKAGEQEKNVREEAILAEAKVAYYENEAYTDYLGTTKNPVIEKNYALVTAEESAVYEETDTGSRQIGSMKKGSLAYIIKEADENWLYIESDDVRGFMAKGDLDASDQVQTEVTEKGEDSYQLAEELIDPSENRALYYSRYSVKEGSPYHSIRSELLAYAKQFLGTPYVFGGTSLTEGCDCSGFAMGIYGHFGYSLPRSSAYQSVAGTQIPVSEAQPGDLIFYATNGIVHHVVIYQGDGKTVEAKGTGYGVCESSVASNAVWAVSILQDELDENYIGAEQN